MIEQIISAIKSEQAKMAQAALRSPSARDEFEYGRVCGMHAGLERALVLIDDLIKDRNEKEKNL
jgi:hypothetical protein